MEDVGNIFVFSGSLTVFGGSFCVELAAFIGIYCIPGNEN